MTEPDDRSAILFGRYQALGIHFAIAHLAKPEFTTGQVTSLLTGVRPDAVSKELSKLRDLDLIRSTSRSGDYERIDDTCYWEFIGALGAEWGLA